MKIAALIPCRTGSKGIPGKNFKEFCGKPLYKWTLDSALESKVFDEIILSSDGGFHGPSQMAQQGKCRIITDNNRISELSNDEASLDDLLCYYHKKHEDVDLWCLLQPTSPLRTADDIRQAKAMMDLKSSNGDIKYESLVSVFPNPVMAWFKECVGIPGDDETRQHIATYHYEDRPNRQERTSWFLENGAIYFTRSYVIKHTRLRLHGSIALFEMPYERSFEIDEPLDWFLCEKMIERRSDGVA